VVVPVVLVPVVVPVVPVVRVMPVVVPVVPVVVLVVPVVVPVVVLVPVVVPAAPAQLSTVTVLGLTRLHGPIRVKRSGSTKGVEDGQDGQALLA
jgi:hypothetical protein